MTIREAKVDDLPELAQLMDAYRVFYAQPSDSKAAGAFLSDRIELRDSRIFIALLGEKAVGFTQLYPSFSSVGLIRIYILNDLYVNPDYRGQGIGEALLKKAQEFCISEGARGLALETAVENPAQYLYERLGWIKDESFFHYFWTSPTHNP